MKKSQQNEPETPRQDNLAGEGLQGTAPSKDNDIPRLGNRKLIGKIQVKSLDILILVMAVVLIVLFAYFILKR